MLVGGTFDGVSVGAFVALGRSVAVGGLRVGVRVIVRVGDGPKVGDAVRVGVTVRVGVSVRVGLGVKVGRGVRVSVAVRVGVGVRVGVLEGAGVAASPSRVKLPDRFHSIPTKSCTSYSPGIHSWAGGSQSV